MFAGSQEWLSVVVEYLWRRVPDSAKIPWAVRFNLRVDRGHDIVVTADLRQIKLDACSRSLLCLYEYELVLV